MGWLGSALGSLAGEIGSKVLPIPGVKGGEVGRYIGGFLPFQSGGMVSHQRAGLPATVMGVKSGRVAKAYKKGGKVRKHKKKSK
jgi:hypothetical protein